MGRAQADRLRGIPARDYSYVGQGMRILLLFFVLLGFRKSASSECASVMGGWPLFRGATGPAGSRAPDRNDPLVRQPADEGETPKKNKKRPRRTMFMKRTVRRENRPVGKKILKK